MQQRHKDRSLYFKELADTSRKFYIDYVERWKPVGANTRVLEIGCGEGGNLLPFAERGCQVTGIDINERQIDNASLFFGENGREGKFIASDFLMVPEPKSEEDRFDVVLIHDDLLATGGTALAVYKLVKLFNPKKIYMNFIIEIKDEGLNGREVLKDINLTTLLTI